MLRDFLKPKEHIIQEPAPEHKCAKPLKIIRVATISSCNMPAPALSLDVDGIIEDCLSAQEYGIAIACFHELCLTGASAQDLLFSDSIYEKQTVALEDIADATRDTSLVIILGAMIKTPEGMANGAVVMQGGEIVGEVTASTSSGNGKMLAGLSSGSAGATDSRYFSNTPRCPILFSSLNGDVRFSIEVGDDYKDLNSQGRALATAGAHIVFNPRAQLMIAGGEELEIADIKTFTKKTASAYVAAGPGKWESSTYGVYGGHSYIAEDGEILQKSTDYLIGPPLDFFMYSDINIEAIEYKRRKAGLGNVKKRWDELGVSKYEDIDIRILPKPLNRIYLDDVLSEDDSMSMDFMASSREYHRNPFLPFGEDARDEKYAKLAEIFEMQATALQRRIMQVSAQKLVIGISGGLDSTVALLVAVHALEKCHRPASDIIAITMPSFGTSDRTYENAVKLIELLGAEFREISIKDAILSHFAAIGQDSEKHDLTYENAQARERTQILMDIAGKEDGFVVGTGDMSELALGWCTFGGDHMSMYGVNAGVPKTVLQELVRWYADAQNGYPYSKSAIKGLSEVLINVVETPISPELVPGEDDAANGGKPEIPAQKTEDKVGPYELHDFFIYHHFVNGASRDVLRYIARVAFYGRYDAAEIDKWLRVFFERVYSQQYKRNCSPDAPLIFEVDLMPHGGLILPSDIDTFDDEEW